MTNKEFDEGYLRGKRDTLKKMFDLGLILYSKPDKVYFVNTKEGGLLFIETEVGPDLDPYYDEDN